MLKQVEINGKIIKTYSNSGNYFVKVGKPGKYRVAYDKKPVNCRYVEIKEKIIPEEVEEEKTYEQELEELKRKYNKG